MCFRKSSKTGRIGFMKFIEKLRRLSNRARLTALLDAVFAFAESIGGVFFSVFLWRSTGLIRRVAIYQFYFWMFIFLGFLVVGYGFKKKGMSVLYRVSFLMHFVFYAALLLLRERSIDLIVPLGMFGGVAGAFYWSAHQVMVFSGTSDDTREIYYGVSGALTSFAAAIAPILAGWLIWLGSRGGGENLTGYYYVFGLLALVFLISEVGIKKTREVVFEEFSFKGTLKLFKENSMWRFNMIKSFFDGLTITRGFLWSILSFVVLKSELWLGMMMGAMAGLAVLSNVVIGVIYKPRLRKRLNSIGMVLMLVAGILYPLLLNPTGLIIDQVLGEMIGYPLFYFAWLAYYYLVVEMDKKGAKNQFNYYVGHELAQGIGRILSIGLFVVFLNQATQINMARWWFGGLSFAFVAQWWFLEKMRREIVKTGYVVDENA